MSGLLALVADSLTLGLRRAVTGNMADLTTVVALLALSAIAGHVAESATRIAGLLPTAVSTTEPASVAATLGTAASNMSNLTALVTFLATGSTSASVAIGRTRLRAFARNVTTDAATVARLLLRSYGAFSANVTLSTTVVTGRSSLLGAVTSLVRCITAVEASTASVLVVHFEFELGKAFRLQEENSIVDSK